ncbi:hypothetical protein BKA70DRAFT_1214176 [Coprinopsis sp. MPI-PUGE-AT-0042]|nr:hypothetical protein BKA70DRAFT_1214176 [Coprinopsis sp. MPI-PUGE-AT-0042]
MSDSESPTLQLLRAHSRTMSSEALRKLAGMVSKAEKKNHETSLNWESFTGEPDPDSSALDSNVEQSENDLPDTHPYTSELLRFADLWEEEEKQNALEDLAVPPPPPLEGELPELDDDGRPMPTLPHSVYGPPSFDFSPWSHAETVNTVDRVYATIIELIDWLHCFRGGKFVALRTQSRGNPDSVKTINKLSEMVHDPNELNEAVKIELEVSCGCRAHSEELFGAKRQQYDIRCPLGGGFRLSTVPPPPGSHQAGAEPKTAGPLVGVFHRATAAAIDGIRAAKGLLNVHFLGSSTATESTSSGGGSGAQAQSNDPAFLNSHLA